MCLPQEACSAIADINGNALQPSPILIPVKALHASVDLPVPLRIQIWRGEQLPRLPDICRVAAPFPGSAAVLLLAACWPRARGWPALAALQCFPAGHLFCAARVHGWLAGAALQQFCLWPAACCCFISIGPGFGGFLCALAGSDVQSVMGILAIMRRGRQ